MTLRPVVIALAAAVLSGCGDHKQPAPKTSLTQAPISGRASPIASKGNPSPDVRPQPLPADVASTCDSAVAFVARATGTSPKRADGAFKDSFGGTERLGCRVLAEVPPAADAKADPHATVIQTFGSRGWAQDLRYAADGADESSLGMRRRDMLCIVAALSGGVDDADSTSTQPSADSAEVRVECARDVPSNANAGVPDSLWRTARAAGFDSVYAIDVRLQYPPFVSSDFDGDGTPDAAVLVTERATGKVGVVFLLASPRRAIVAGAGSPIPGGSDDFGAVTTWDKLGRGAIPPVTIYATPNQALLADALWLGRADSSSGFLEWTGGGFKWDERPRAERRRPSLSQAPAAPAVPLVELGRCPFECCQLGDWKAARTERAYAREEGTGAPAFMIPAGAGIRADSADFFTLRLGVLVARRSFSILEHAAPGTESPPRTPADSMRFEVLRRPLAKGDTLYYVGDVPETGSAVWSRGYRVIVDGDWDSPDAPNPNAAAVEVRPIQQQWWVHISYAGRTGWIEVWHHLPHGADACG